jgi:hypothetical protein
MEGLRFIPTDANGLRVRDFFTDFNKVWRVCVCVCEIPPTHSESPSARTKTAATPVSASRDASPGSRVAQRKGEVSSIIKLDLDSSAPCEGYLCSRCRYRRIPLRQRPDARKELSIDMRDPH